MVKRDVYVRLLVGTVLAVLVTPALAQEAAAPELKLSLGEALRIALENNLDLVIARKNPSISEQNVIIAESVFDSDVEAHGRYNPQDTDTTYGGAGAPPDTTSSVDLWNVGASWGQKVTFGADYRLSYNYTETDPSPTLRVDPDLGITSVSDNLFKGSTLAFEYNMPLLKGFGREVNTRDIVLASNDLQISRGELTLAAQTKMKQVEDAYWDLLAFHAAVKVANESLTLAHDLLTLNQKKVDVGTLAPIEIVQAESGVASREEGVIVAQQGVGDAEDILRSLLAFPKDDPRWNATIVATDRPTFEARSVDLNRALELALQNRPELERRRLELESSRLSERVAEKGVRHRLDLSLAATQSDNDSDIRSAIVGGPGGATVLTQTDQGFDWSVAVVYGYPIGNRAAKANYAVAELTRQQSEVNMAAQEQDIRVDVRAAVRNVESGVKRVQAAQAATVLQRKTLEAEQKKFENGMSTSFEVLRIQTDLSNAQLAEIRAVLDYNKALADLERAQGTLLGARGLVLEMPSGGTN